MASVAKADNQLGFVYERICFFVSHARKTSCAHSGMSPTGHWNDYWTSSYGPPMTPYQPDQSASSRRSRLEQRLETNLESNLPRLIAWHGHQVMVIGRQVPLGPGLRVDLLLIDQNGDLYATEVKGFESKPVAVSQGLSYRHAIRMLSREEVLSIARDHVGIRFERRYAARFQRPLPKSLNHTQIILIIGLELDDHTARSVMELHDREGTQIYAFRFDERQASTGLIPCARNHDDLLTSAHRSPVKHAVKHAVHHTLRRPRYTPTPHVREFWSWASVRFTSPIVTVASIFSNYEAWIAAAPLRGSDLTGLPFGAFSRQLASVVREEGLWMQVFVRPEDEIDPSRLPTLMPSVRLTRDAQHRISAYSRQSIP